MKNISVDNMMDPLWGLATRNIYMLCMDMEFWHEDFCEEFLNDFLLFHLLTKENYHEQRTEGVN